MKAFIITTLVLIVIGNIAKSCNEEHHKALALKICGSNEAIDEVNSSRFTCISSSTTNTNVNTPKSHLK
jgi:hypothetical protein